MAIVDHSVSHFTICLQFFLLAMKIAGEVFVTLLQSLDVIDGTLIYTAAVNLALPLQHKDNTNLTFCNIFTSGTPV